MSNPFDLLHANHSQNKPAGVSSVYIAGTRFSWASAPLAPQPIIHPASITLVGRGAYALRLNDQEFAAQPDQLLVSALPLACSVTHAPNQAGPYRAISLPLRLDLVRELAASIFDFQPEKRPTKGAHYLSLTPFRIGPGMADALKRLLTTMLSPMDSRAMGDALILELHYRLLMSAQGPALLAFASEKSVNARIAKSLPILMTRFNQPLAIEDMADWADMSGSAFHRAFKQVMGDSPLQYLKKIRLSKAYELLQPGDIKAGEAAHAVGYESLSQFSREFKRHFGYPPSNINRLG